jgi:hypothetical protein
MLVGAGRYSIAVAFVEIPIAGGAGRFSGNFFFQRIV